MLKASNSFSIRCVVVLLLLITLLTFTVGRVVPVSALADPQPEFEPVYNTEIIRLADYVDNTLTDAQEDLFYFMFGAYLVAHGAMSEYHLDDPYTNSDGVIGWIKSTGIQLYNALVDQTAIMTPAFILQQGLQTVVDYAMGIAQKAGLYPSLDNYLDEMSMVDYKYFPINRELQIGVNSFMTMNNSLYNFQYAPVDFSSSFNWYKVTLDMVAANAYQSYLFEYFNGITPIRCNNCTFYYNNQERSSWSNIVANIGEVSNYNNIFFNTSNHTVYLVDSAGNRFNPISSNYKTASKAIYVNPNSLDVYDTSYELRIYGNTISFEGTDFLSLIDDYLTNGSFYSRPWFQNSYLVPDLGAFLNKSYYGTDWSNKVEISNTADLNLTTNNFDYYWQVTNDYLFDIKGLINNLVNQTDLFTVFINNLFNPDGTLNINPSLIKVSVDLPVSLDTPALPVNLNEIATYTDNDYLDIVKQSATDYGNTIGQWFVFLHNSDPALLYTLLGSVIVILLGAFIGKWGHS